MDIAKGNEHAQSYRGNAVITDGKEHLYFKQNKLVPFDFRKIET